MPPSFKVIGLLVPQKKSFKSFYHIWACDITHLYSLTFPHHMEARHEIWLQSTKEKTFENNVESE